MAQSYTLKGNPEIGEGHISVAGMNYSYTTQGKWDHYASTSYLTYMICWTSAAAQNDQIDYVMWLSKGTYTCVIYATTSTGFGISTILIDGTSAGTMDWYSGSAVYGVRNTLTGITVSTSGKHVLGIKMATKNASSSGYNMYIHTICMFRTA